MKKDLVSIKDLSAAEMEELFSLTDALKKNGSQYNSVLKGKTLALIFQKPSCRTRVSFEVGMHQLGGNSLYLGPDELLLGVRESIKDVAKTLSRYLNGIVLRTFAHNNVVEMASGATIPVINGLSDFSHPCQALADVYSIKEKLGDLKGATLAYVGDGNNVCHSLLYACAKIGLNMHISSPKGFEPAVAVYREAHEIAKSSNASIDMYSNPLDAVMGADVIYTDVWTSMGQEKEDKERKKIFKDFQVNKKLVDVAKENVLVMHCLPAHRQEEITDEVLDSRNSIVFDQAENRMHVQKAILIKLLGN